MWDEDIVVPIAFFVSVIIMAIGIPLVRGIVRRWDRKSVEPSMPTDTAARLDRIEQAIECRVGIAGRDEQRPVRTGGRRRQDG